MGIFRKLKVHIKITIKLIITVKSPAFNSMSTNSTHNLSVPQKMLTLKAVLQPCSLGQGALKTWNKHGFSARGGSEWRFHMTLDKQHNFF